VTQKKAPKAPVLRFRCSPEQEAHVKQAAIDAGFSTVADYLRRIVLESTVITVAGGDIVVIPSATASSQSDKETLELIANVIREVNASRAAAGDEAADATAGEEPGEAPPPPQVSEAPGAEPESPPPPSAGALASPAAELGSPPEGDVAAVPGPQLPTSTPAQGATAGSIPEAGGEIPPEQQMQTCGRCGYAFPAPVELHHSMEDCDRLIANRQVQAQQLAEARARAEAAMAAPPLPPPAPLPPTPAPPLQSPVPAQLPPAPPAPAPQAQPGVADDHPMLHIGQDVPAGPAPVAAPPPLPGQPGVPVPPGVPPAPPEPIEEPPVDPGPTFEGETFGDYVARRSQELTTAGRTPTVAAQEAAAEWRQMGIG
jgi:hypothetical protein